jgi:anti-sigma regulatory factor (Ser/Thr protein kinase)
MISLTLPRSLDAAGLARTAIAPVTEHLPEDRRADFDLLVSELVNNAVMHGSGRIELRVERRGTALWTEVSDEGPGFDATPKRSSARAQAAGAFTCSMPSPSGGGWRRARPACGSRCR